VVANIGLRDQFFDLARSDLPQDAQLTVIPFNLRGCSAFARETRARGFDQPDRFLLKTTAGTRHRRCNSRTVRNSGAGGRIPAGRYSPAAACLACHFFLLLGILVAFRAATAP